MQRIVIIDDEKHCTDILESLLLKIHSNYKIVGVFNDPIEALNFVKNNEIDLLFLDIQMPKMDGFRFLDQLEGVDFDVIITTAFDQYAIKAFEYSAMHYLLKPISEKALDKAIQTWSQNKKKVLPMQWDMLKSFLGDKEKKKDKLALPTRLGFEIVDLDTIVRCRAESNYVLIVFKDNKSLLVSRTLKELEELLVEHSFLRVHQSHLINLNYIKAVLKIDGGTFIKMTDDEEVPVSRQKRNYVYKILENKLHFL